MENSRYLIVMRRALITIMEKAADLTVVWKTLAPFTRRVSQRRSLLMCCIKTYIWNVNWRGKFGEKRCTSHRDNHNLEWIVKQSEFKNFLKWTSQGPDWGGKRTGLLLCGSKLFFQIIRTFCISYHCSSCLKIKPPQPGGRVERHRICLKSSMKFPSWVTI